jgi:membrane-associated protease RseP (regulator of RpoE activity)
MKAKHALSLLVALILTTGIALAQQSPAPPPAPESQPESLEDDQESSFSFFVDGGGFLGVYAEDINKENMSRFNLNQVRGVAITRIVKDSPAEKAGLRKDDVILRIDNENVTSVRRLNRLVSEIAPDQTVRVAISRGGAEQELTATMGRRNSSNAFKGFLSDKMFQGNLKDFGTWEWDRSLQNHDGPWVFAFGAGRRIGVSTTELSKQLAEYFGVPGGKGVLVTSVSEDGPAARAGIKAGDVITAIDGEAIDSVGDISRVLNQKKEGEVALTIIRNKSQQTIRVTPKAGGLSTGSTGGAQIGRRIVIPRIQIDTMPTINISMPRIEMPTIPPININLPRIRIDPKIRVIRRTGGPI